MNTFWTVVAVASFWLSFGLFLTAWPVATVFLVIFVYAAHQVRSPERPYEPEAVKVKFPCPRCSHEHVDLYSQGRWDYFTCGGCGARGWYPFRTSEQRHMRLRNQ